MGGDKMHQILSPPIIMGGDKIWRRIDMYTVSPSHTHYPVFNYRDQGETIKINWNEPWLCKKCFNTQSQCCFVSSRQERGGSCCLGFHFHKHPTTHPLSLSSSLFALQLNTLNFLVHWIVDSTVCVDAKIMTAACFSCYRKRGKCLLEMRDCLDFPVWALGGGE